MTKTLSPELLKKKLSSKYKGIFPLEFDDMEGMDDQEEDDGVAIPDTIHLIPIGSWDHDLYGPIMITAQDIREFIQNFNAGIRKGVYITAGHEGYEELPAKGWITRLEARDNGLWGDVEWNEGGKDCLSDKEFKFFSPEFYRDYEDPQTHQIYRNVLTGGALTKSPYFKELEAIVFSEAKLKKSFNNNENAMDIKTVLAKAVADLTVEEKAFIKSKEAELTPEQKTAVASVLAEVAAPVETDAEKAAREEKEKGDANEAAGLNRDGSAKVAPEAAAAKMSEKVMITAGELALLRSRADKGEQAFATIRKNELDTKTSAFVFSEANKAGKFLPKSKDSLRAFIETLNDAQLLSFSTIVSEMPAMSMFTEVGAGGGAEVSATAEVEAKIKTKMDANKTMKYSEALKEVMSENKGLEERYDKGLPAAKGKVAA